MRSHSTRLHDCTEFGFNPEWTFPELFVVETVEERTTLMLSSLYAAEGSEQT